MYDPNTEIWTVQLNKYQRDNLLWLLNCCGFCSPALEPLNFCNSGDWLGEIGYMLADDKPVGRLHPDTSNMTRDQLATYIQLWR